LSVPNWPRTTCPPPFCASRLMRS